MRLMFQMFLNYLKYPVEEQCPLEDLLFYVSGLSRGVRNSVQITEMRFVIMQQVLFVLKHRGKWQPSFFFCIVQ